MQLDKDARAQAIIKRMEGFITDRSQFENLYTQVNSYVDPAPNRFQGNVQFMQGETNTSRYFDDTPTQALLKGVAGIDSALTPHSQRWHGLGIQDQTLNKNKEVRKYLEETVDVLFAMRYSTNANFANQVHECYLNLFKFGTCGLYISDDIGKNIQYKSIGLEQLYCAEDASGKVNSVYRKFEYTCSQAAEIFGYDKLPDRIQQKLKDSPDSKFWFLHAVEPNIDYSKRIKTAERMRFKSTYLCYDTKEIISEGGYRTMPYAVSRYRTNSGEIYGRCPAIDKLPDIKMLNRLAYINLRGAEKVVDPAILASEDGYQISLNLNPGMISYGIDRNGNPMFMPMQTGAQVDVGLEILDRLRDSIFQAFNISLFQLLADTSNSNLTATEVNVRQQEKAAEIAPLINRQRSEFLGPIIDREISIAANAGKLPQKPDILIDYEAKNGIDEDNNDFFKVEYVSPFTQIMESNKTIAIMNTLGIGGQMAQFDSNVIKYFNLPVAIQEIAQINGMPADILRTDEEVEQMKQAEAQQQQLQQVLQAAPQIADTAKTLADAQRIAGAPAQL